MRLDQQLPRHCFFVLALAAIGSGCLHSETPQVSPDFSLKATPSAVSITDGGSASMVSVSATALNGFKGTIEVKVSGMPAGVTATPESFSLAAGATEKVNLLASATASGLPKIYFTGTSGSLSHEVAIALTVKVDVVTHHYDIGRTGLNASEAILTHANVNAKQFGLLRVLPVDGAVDAEPLMLTNLEIGGAVRDVVYAVTEHDSVYAFDAAGTRLWKTSVLGAGETPSDDHGCGQISPEIGITSTPVIDRKFGEHGAIFVVAMTLDKSGNYHQRLHALDITTGAELAHSPTEVKATFPGTGDNSSNGKVVFDPSQYAERAGLLLMNGELYLAWTSHCDSGPYTGWLMSYNESTLAQTSVLDVTPNGSEGAIWMAGSGLAADANGFIYFLDGNGTFDASLNKAGFPVSGDYGNGFIKASTTGGKLAVADYFEMFNTVSESNNDEDLGSGGAMVLPDLTDKEGKVHQLAVGAGKDGNIYIVNRDAMGKWNPNNDSAIYQEVDGTIGGVWSMPAYYNNKVFYAAVSDNLKAFPIANAKLASSPINQSANSFPYPGATPSISARGVVNGIVWAEENSSPAVLHAYRALDLLEIYNSNQAANSRDNFGDGNKFITPMIANGRVYVGTPSGVAVFGLLP
jgi:hypothetical protein